MSALPVDDTAKARRSAARAIATARHYYPDLAPWQRLEKARTALASNATEFLLEGHLDLARESARAYELVNTRLTRILTPGDPA